MQLTSGIRMPRALLFALAFALAASTDVAADVLRIKRTDPPKSFRFVRGGDPVLLEILVESVVDGPNGDEIAFGVHDQRDRNLMTRPMPYAKVKQGRESVLFKATIKSLDPDVKEVIVDVILVRAVRTPRRSTS